MLFILHGSHSHTLYLIYALLSQIQLCRDYALFGGRPGNSVYFGNQAPSQKKSRSQKKGKEERRGERERIEKRGEEESKWGMKEKREIKERDKRGRQLHQTKPRNVRAKKIRKRKGKEEGKYWSQKN